MSESARSQSPIVALRRSPLALAFAVSGVAITGLSFVLATTKAHQATSQDWSPFVLVAGLLLIGLVADDDGLFRWAGALLARSPNAVTLFVGAGVLTVVVTAFLNLDTSVAFLTPIFVYTARHRQMDEAPLLYGCLFLSNAGSLFLPGSNLTNLIVLNGSHLSGAQFFARAWAPALSAAVVTGLVVGLAFRRELVKVPRPTASRELLRPTAWLGSVGVGGAAVFILAFRTAALPVFVLSVAIVAVHLVAARQRFRRVFDVLGVPTQVGLLGVAIGLGTIGRSWNAPMHVLDHAGVWGVAAVAAASSVLVNNLPAASLLSANTPPHPFALLLGLNVGPNLCVTGSLAWLLWLRTAKVAGAVPSLVRASAIGVFAVPLSLAVALGVLVIAG